MHLWKATREFAVVLFAKCVYLCAFMACVFLSELNFSDIIKQQQQQNSLHSTGCGCLLMRALMWHFQSDQYIACVWHLLATHSFDTAAAALMVLTGVQTAEFSRWCPLITQSRGLGCCSASEESGLQPFWRHTGGLLDLGRGPDANGSVFTGPLQRKLIRVLEPAKVWTSVGGRRSQPTRRWEMSCFPRSYANKQSRPCSSSRDLYWKSK